MSTTTLLRLVLVLCALWISTGGAFAKTDAPVCLTRAQYSVVRTRILNASAKIKKLRLELAALKKLHAAKILALRKEASGELAACELLLKRQAVCPKPRAPSALPWFVTGLVIIGCGVGIGALELSRR